MRSWLIGLRKKTGNTQKEVADHAGISAPSYCNIEHGKKSPRVATAKKIAEFLGFDWTRFFE